MSGKLKGLSLFVLCVLLLTVISARVSPGTTYGAEPSPPVDETQWPVVSHAPAPAETPEVLETPAPTPGIRDYLPSGISLTDWNLWLVNNSHVLSPTFAPGVVAVRNGQYFDARASEALEAMLAGAEDAGYTVCLRAAYRPYQTQATLFYGRASIISESQDIEYARAEQLARSVVAYPGTSDHQTGLGCDIMDKMDTPMTAEEAEELPVLVWLRDNCADYGFIARYPKDKQSITGWYEPWHFRYVGEDAARYIMDNDLTLEEFHANF